MLAYTIAYTLVFWTTIVVAQPLTPVRHVCIAEAYISQQENTYLSSVTSTDNPNTFNFTQIGPLSNVSYNNIGFRDVDGLIYGVQIGATNSIDRTYNIVQIDGLGRVFPLGLPVGLPTNRRFNAGDVSPDGSTMFISTGEDHWTRLYKLDLSNMPNLPLPPVQIVIMSGSIGKVYDWAYNVDDDHLYGGDNEKGKIVRLNPTTGVRTNLQGISLPGNNNIAYGAAWFNQEGFLFIYRNNGQIYKIDLAIPVIVNIMSGPDAGGRNDGSRCRNTTDPVTNAPTSEPTVRPTKQPVSQPTSEPTVRPTSEPTDRPTVRPTNEPTDRPTSQPTNRPTDRPTDRPTSEPTKRPTDRPTERPTSEPTERPTGRPTSEPTDRPTVRPTGQPTDRPTSEPTVRPTGQPTNRPTNQPTDRPTSQPTNGPTGRPTKQPTERPATLTPTKQPTNRPTGKPTKPPTNRPTNKPTKQPTYRPTVVPTDRPTFRPTKQPTNRPTNRPTKQPTAQPTKIPIADDTDCDSTCKVSQSINMLAGQFYLVGNAVVYYDSNLKKLCVDINLIDGCTFSQIHFLFVNVNNLPNNLTPGQFPYKLTLDPPVNDYLYCVSLLQFPSNAAGALHLEVACGGQSNYNFAQETAWGNGTVRRPNKNWAMWFSPSWRYDCCPY